jgi:diguanylate cyclase (GGDEF)-like protein
MTAPAVPNSCDDGPGSDRTSDDSHARDLAAAERDRAADARDAAMRELDAANRDTGAPRSAADVLLRAADQRRRAREHRVAAAEHRAEAAQDRLAAAEDRRQAARERARSIADRQALVSELARAATDPVTGARMRTAGLAELELEINRTRRTTAGLVVAYIDVVGLKSRNDARGHAAGDALLKHVVVTITEHLRPYDRVVRLGGDEFVVAMSGAGLPEVHRRFRLVAAALGAGDDPVEITTGFAELHPEDTLADLIARADRDLIDHRRTLSAGTRDRTTLSAA